MLRKILAVAAAAALLLGTASSASGITRGGVPDDGEHPNVALMVALVGGVPQWRCSGTFISPTVYVTAGHCTSGATSVEIWLDEDVQSGRPGNGYPFAGDVSGTPYTHPLYDDAAFYLYDLGVVVMDREVDLPVYGSLPEVGVWDSLATARGRQDVTVEAVGYGLQSAKQNDVRADLIRLKADLMLVNVDGVGGIPKGTSVFVSGDSKRGGTCFGDSGGPLFLGTDSTVIGAVTSFGLNSNCAGVGGGYRIDKALDLAWIRSFPG
jgi:secreted trypsin-like serine protease